MMEIKVHRIYEKEQPKGFRVLVDRLWPRGISKEDADLDDHWKEIAPSDELRKWFDHDSDKWADFRKKYLKELSANKEIIKERLQEVDRNTLVLLYAAKDTDHNNAVVLKEYINRLG
ncbi:DUF488 domain-containing protein [Kangiella spongicola]|uniref:DUF488 domain-containing protein n=2 Tax=Kangiella spongicola TaxID=796379 RepID=A0A318D4N3_9GAMM|nr:DUF488 domain-containing protein [Kangiella spongicola]